MGLVACVSPEASGLNGLVRPRSRIAPPEASSVSDISGISMLSIVVVEDAEE